MMSLAGAAMLFWPSAAVEAATSPTSGVLVYVWALVFLVSGFISWLGALTDRWLGEYAGLPALALTFLVYGLSAFGASGGRPSAIAGGLALSAIAALLMALWHEVDVVRREALKAASREG
jgi:hypothetical protein